MSLIFDSTRARILAADTLARDAGVPGNWYEREGAELAALAERFNVSRERVAGAAAALAPRAQWGTVKSRLPGFLGDRTAPAWSGLRRSAERAEGIIRSGDLSLLGKDAPKSEAFLRNLLGDFDPVTVDVWAARIAGARVPGSRKAYDSLALAYRDVAVLLGDEPATLQARTWTWAQARKGAELARLAV